MASLLQLSTQNTESSYFCTLSSPTPDKHDSIVFVHGLFGHPYRTWATGTEIAPSIDDASSEVDRQTQFWKKPKFLVPYTRRNSSWSTAETLTENSNVTFWLQDLLPSVLPSARVFTWGYDANVSQFVSPTSNLSISQQAETFLSDLANVRTTYWTRSTKIIFVAHSLGGIVVKKALCSSATSKTQLGEILRQTAGVCFLGTPHRGARIASWGKLALDMSKVFLRQPNTDLMHALKENSEMLQYISQEFSRLLVERSFHIYSFREEYPYHGVMIVDDYSSSVGDGMEDCSTIPSNHRDMTKFSSAENTGFVRISAILERWESEWRMRRENFCLSSITHSETSVRIDNIETPFESTYTWILQNNADLHRWLEDRTNNIFWISGIPGCGKSTAMKYVMRNPLTRTILTDWDPQDWVVAGFFFHELGSKIQNSVGGLYAEILFRILRVHRKLLSSYVEPIYHAKCEIVAGTNSRLDDDNRYVFWSDEELRDILLSCVQQTAVHVNACLFIDALDEHSGDHRQLLNFLQSMVSKANPTQVRIKLCLASRPENVFKDALSSCAGFAMHTKTSADIDKYVYGRMTPELSRSRLTKPAIRTLVQDVVKNARGVFLWVVLVVPELIEGICDGDSIDELRSALDAMPPDLGDLYHRALRRKGRRSLSDTLRIKRAYERWVMFRMALSIPHNFPLETFIDIATFNATLDIDGKRVVSTRISSFEDMTRRLAVRTAGLIDAPFDRMHNRYTVRLIHQTVEEFIRSPKASEIMSEGLPSKLLEDGDYFVCRRRILDMRQFGLESLLPFEIIAFTKIVSEMDKITLYRFYADLHSHSLPVALQQLRPTHSFEREPQSPFIGAQLPDYGKLVIFTYWALGYPIKPLLEHPDVNPIEEGPPLLSTAVWCRIIGERCVISPVSSPSDILQEILDAGVHPDSKDRGRTVLEVLVTRTSLSQASEKALLDVFTRLFAVGADPNQQTTCWEGASLLHVVAKSGKKKLLDFLLENGADPSRTDVYGKTYLEYVPAKVPLPQDQNKDNVGISEAPMIVVSEWDESQFFQT